jgi:CIC family chloride channel protein
MVAIVFANLTAYNWYGRSLYDYQLKVRGIDLSMGRERAYLLHHKVAQHATASLPVVRQTADLGALRLQMNENSSATAVIVDDDNRYLGQIFQRQLYELDDEATIGSIELQQGSTFTENTSIWEAMEIMRSYFGEAIAVVDSASGLYLGAVAEAVVINAYLDAAEDLRREEYEV